MDMNVIRLAQALKDKTVERRRDFHKYAEVAWTEFRTAATVADVLTSLGYKVLVGDEVIVQAAMMGVPSTQELENHIERAIRQGGNPIWVEKMRGGKTGVVGIMRFGKPGPTVALRFDMDANDAIEAQTEDHRPFRENFASVNKGAMHACGHDGHTAIGLAVAEILVVLRERLAGTVKLVFQPAEEGVRGGKAMIAKGVVDDVNYFIGMHLGNPLRKTGQIACDTKGFLATSKLDAEFIGVPAHAGSGPEIGRNALLAATTAVANLHAIARHSAGASRINVGMMQAGTGRNIIPANALIKMETRGETSEINEFMHKEAVRIIKAAAAMHEVQVAICEMGSAAGGQNDPAFVERLCAVAKHMGVFSEIVDTANVNGSDDCTYFMKRVQEMGGEAAFIIIGSELAAGHHDFHFDFDEEAMVLAAAFLSEMVADLTRGSAGTALLMQ